MLLDSKYVVREAIGRALRSYLFDGDPFDWNAKTNIQVAEREVYPWPDDVDFSNEKYVVYSATFDVNGSAVKAEWFWNYDRWYMSFWHPDEDNMLTQIVNMDAGRYDDCWDWQDPITDSVIDLIRDR